MFARVRLLNGFPQPLTYLIPPHLESCAIGTLVKVPLKEKHVSGIIMSISENEELSFTVKPISQIEPFPADPAYFSYIEQLSDYFQIEPINLLRRMRHFLMQAGDVEITSTALEEGDRQIHLLTDEQQKVVDSVEAAMHESVYQPTVLHGVTGSGKTEVYKHLIVQAAHQNKSVILMLPEVTLALRFMHLMRECLPTHIPVFGFHSASTPKEKKQLWSSLLQGAPCLIIGVHLPILLPIANLGLIIIDEEHDIGYQEKKHPKINSKEAALIRAHQAKIPILLGSATPSVATMYQVQRKQWHYFQLKQRFAGAFPKIKCVSLTKDKERKSFWISKELQKSIADRLSKGEQTIIFLNRRGYSFFVQCKECSYIFTCDSCSVSLTLHENNRLSCHYCTYEQLLPTQCPSCKRDERSFIKKGIGTQQVVNILQQQFPHARIARADLDATSKKKAWQETVRQIERGQLDIIVGTQTITKGYHFPKVTLVGVLWADLNLHFPIYNAAETTVQQLIQVAGRAGRASSESLVIIQSMIDHPIFEQLHEIEYDVFCKQELEKRAMVGYPPCIRFAEIEIKYKDEARLEEEAMVIAQQLQEQATSDVMVLGPAKPPVSKIKNMHARKIYLKAPSIKALAHLFKKIEIRKFKSSIYFTPNPLS